MTRGFKEGRDHAWRQFDDDEMTGIAARTCIKHGSRVVNRNKTTRKSSRNAMQGADLQFGQAGWTRWTAAGRMGKAEI